jgi:hypothetical protein
VAEAFVAAKTTNFFCRGEKGVFEGGFAKTSDFIVVFLW